MSYVGLRLFCIPFISSLLLVPTVGAMAEAKGVFVNLKILLEFVVVSVIVHQCPLYLHCLML